MKRIYITLVARVDNPTDSPEDIGEVVVVDWDTKKVIKTIIAGGHYIVDTSRSRGAYGVTWQEDKLYVACRQNIIVFDPYDDYKELDVILLGNPAGHHQIKAHNGFIYVVCTGGDLVRRIKDGRIEQTYCARGGGYQEGVANDTLHFNSITWDSNDNEYHLYMRPRYIVNYTTGQRLNAKLGNMPHDLCFLDDNRLLFTDSANGHLRLFNIETNETITVFSKPTGNKGGGYQISGFMRGVGYDKESNSVFVGTAPGILYELDADTWAEKNVVIFETKNGSAVYDILFDPRDWRS